MKPILIHKSDSTIFANVNKFLTFNLETDLDLTGWQAKFILGWVEKTITDISSKSFEVILSAQDTKQLRTGKQNGTIILTDSNGNIKTVTNTIPFEVTIEVVENEYQEIDLTIPESSGVDIKLKVGASYVTSVNGMTGDVVLDIPSIEGLATEGQLEEGLATKQDVGDYALREEIPSLEGYVKDTDYANNAKAGIIKLASVYGTLMVDSFGTMGASIRTLEQYNAGQNYMFISKGTLENIKDDYVKRGLTENAIEFTDEEKTNARDLIGSVGFKDYASYKEHGVVKINTTFGIGTNASGEIHNIKASDDEITGRSSSYKPIVPKSLDLAVKTGVTTNTFELTEDEKASAKQWLGYATPTDIMQAIASIPQFSISIVEALPETGEKMTLYLVSKGGESPDVYDEYIWIEETSTFEFLGTTAVDLTDYVKNTDYATNSVAGVVKPTSYYGLSMATDGYLTGLAISQVDWDRANDKALISKATFNNVRDSYVKSGITENSTTLTDEESASARTWLGAVGNTDYVTGSKAGIVSVGAHYGTLVLNETGLIGASIRNLSQYTDAPTSLIVGKGTLNNVLTQYSKTVLTTQADYDALETKDANTLYLIEE